MNIKAKIGTLARFAIGLVDIAIMTIRFDVPRKRRRFSRELKRRLCDTQDGKCVYCGIEFGVAGKGLTIDHIIPVAAGGDDDVRNLQGLCRKCNCWKSDHTDSEFRERIQRGLSALGIERSALDRKTLQQAMRVTRMHEDVAQRRTRRFRRRCVVLVVYCYALAMGGYWNLLDWPYLLDGVYPLKYVVVGISWALALGIYLRAAQRGYLRWNPGRR